VPVSPNLNRIVANRIFTLLALVAIAPALLLVVDLPARIYTFNVLNAPVTFEVTNNTLLIALVPALTIAGVDWVLREHPLVHEGALRFLFPFWMAPGVAAIALSVLLTRTDNWSLWIATLVLGIVLIGTLIYAEFMAISTSAAGYANARLTVTALTYVIAFVLFTVIYAQRERSLIAATLTSAIAFTLAIELLEPHVTGLRRTFASSFVIAFLIGQATWALNYWNISNWSAGVLMVALFYVLIGITQQQVQRQLSRAVLIEYAVIACIALIVVLLLASSR
jgi:hypothetical protein